LVINYDIATVNYSVELNASLLTNSRTLNFPDASGTLALVGGAGVGTVTSVAALTLGTSGTDLSSTVANGTTTPVITLNVPTASATNRGALSAADWTTFNNKQPAGTYVTSVTGTAPIVSSGGTTPAISMAAATTSVSGYLTSTDWATFNGKQAALVSGTNIKTVNGTSLLGSGDVGTIAVGYGGLGITTTPSNGQIPIGNGTNYTAATLTAGSGITITNASGSITVANKQNTGPAVSAYKSTNQSITTFTATKITFDTETFDTNNNFASSTFTPTVAGYYQVSAGFFPSADSTTFSRTFLSIYKNGAEWQRLQDITTIGLYITFLGASGSCLVYCNGSTDYIEAYGFIAGTNPVIGSGSTLTYFDAVMVRGA
jgi:hypothetical protein